MKIAPELVAFLGGILMGMAPAPFHAYYLAWVALVPLWILVVGRAKSKANFPEKRKIILTSMLPMALAWGCGYHGLALFWITGIHPMTWMGVPWFASLAIALFCWLFITLWGAAIVVSWAVGFFISINSRLKNSSLINGSLRLLIGVSLWCLLEAIWSQGALFWSSLSYTQSPHNLAILQLSQLSGPSTITAAIVAINGLIAEIILKLKERATSKYRNKFFLCLLLPFILVSLLHFIGFYWYNKPLNNVSKNAIKVGIIQGNVPNEIKLYPEGWRQAIEGYTKGYKHLAQRGVDIILTPETALPFSWENIVNYSSFYPAILEEKVPTWLGAFGQAGKSLNNTLFTVTGDGKIFSRYDKVKLVPLGEYIPFEQFLGKIINRLSPLDAHLAPGKPDQIFETPLGRAIVGICYDSAFAEHFRRQAAAGGEFIVTASNNAHYSNTMPAQHHAQDVMRAIETERWLVRATNTGYSAIVNPRGKTQWQSRLNTYEVHSDTIYRRQTATLYVKWGDWLTVVLVILGLSSWFLNLGIAGSN